VNKIIFVSGKGGVGKSRTTLLLSQKNKEAVLAELVPSLKEEATRLNMPAPRIYRFSKKDLAEELLSRTIKVKLLIHLLAKSKIFQTLLDLSPNIYEILLTRKWFEIAEKKPLIVDAPSTGHFLAFFDAIKTAQSMFDGGAFRKIADELDEALSKAENIEIYIVSLPEQSALMELEEIEAKLKSYYPKLQIKTVINRLHLQPENNLDLSADLKSLAFERPQKEKERIKKRYFDFSVNEGAVSL